MSAQRFVDKLDTQIQGQVFADVEKTARFARDQSLYHIPPACVVIPTDGEDIARTVTLAREQNLPVTVRGGGSGTAGACLGEGVVIQIPRKGSFRTLRLAHNHATSPRVELGAGVVHADLQAYLQQRGFYLPADPSSAEICLLGGNIATKASGPHALKHGSIDRYLTGLRFIDFKGRLVDTTDESTIPRELRQGLDELRQSLVTDPDSVATLQRKASRKIACGYNLFPLLGDRPTGELVTQLLVGSVGTLGVITDATVRLEPFVEGRATVTLWFENLHDAGEAVQHIRQLGVAAIELISRETIALAGERGHFSDRRLTRPGHLLIVELEGAERFDQIAGIKSIANDYPLSAPPDALTEEADQARLWSSRKRLLPAIFRYRPSLRALSVVNDVGVTVERLADFIVEVQRIFTRFELKAAIYGHAGSGNLHLRPLFDIRAPHLTELIRRLADEVYQTVLCFDGTITAEHGMGRLRSPYLKAEWGDSITSYMKRVKQLFDPDGVFNSAAMFSNRPITDNMALLQEVPD